MCEWAVYLRKAIDMYVKQQYFSNLKSLNRNGKEWNFFSIFLSPSKDAMITWWERSALVLKRCFGFMNLCSMSSIDDDDFEQMVNSLPFDANTNEYDAYIDAPRIVEKGNVLDIWRTFSETPWRQ